MRGEMLAPAMIKELLAGEIDIALLRPPVHNPGVVVETLRCDRLFAALAVGYPLAGLDEIRVGDLRNEDFIVHAGHGRSAMNNVLNATCADAGFVPIVRHAVERRRHW